MQICPGSYGMGGGVSEYVQNISERLAKKHSVTVYTTNPKGRLPRHDYINGVKVERFRRIAPNQSYHFSLEMIFKLRQVRFDVVHAHNYHAFPLHFSHLANSEKLVVSPHFHGVGSSVFRNSLFKLWKPFGKRIFLRADQVVAVSKHEKFLIQRYFGLDPSKTIVIPCGVNMADFVGLKKQSHEFKSMLCVGRLERYKGMQYLVEVLPELGKDVVLEIVGNGRIRGELEQRANELGVAERVRFYHDLTREELLQKYANADLFVLLSKYEAFSMVVAEALTAGVPCIVAKTSALKEWVDDEHCFGIDSPINLGGLARLIDRILETKTSRESVRRSTKILDWDQVVEKLESVYRQ